MVVVLTCSEVAAANCRHFCLEVMEKNLGRKPQLLWRLC